MEKQESSNTPDEELVNQLPKAMFCDAMEICNWEGFWFEKGIVKSALTFQKSFEAEDDDVLLASPMKTGTTWLKALSLCILEKNSDNNSDILEKGSPQLQVPTVETLAYVTKPSVDLYSQPSPRLFHTHLPYSVLPESIKNSNCKIIYISRNPKDTLVSQWHFFNLIFGAFFQEPYPLEKAVESFCSGVQQYGPFYEHVLQYWIESQKRPEKILFLKYEDLKRDPTGEVKKLAKFLGKTIGDEEVDKLVWRCSLGRLKNLDVNKNGSDIYAVPNTSYFRSGIVGDWKNHLTPEMEDRINETTRLKLDGSGLHFDT